MDAPEIVVGLDIGTTKIACLVGRKTDHGKIEILGVGKAPSVGVTRGVVSNIEKTVQSPYLMYFDKLLEINKLLRTMAQNQIEFVDYDDDLLQQVNELTTCFSTLTAWSS